MASKRQRAVSEALNDVATVVDGGDGLKVLALLVRAIDVRNLWPELAWEPEAAAADAHRAVARVRRALAVGHAAASRQDGAD